MLFFVNLVSYQSLLWKIQLTEVDFCFSECTDRIHFLNPLKYSNKNLRCVGLDSGLLPVLHQQMILTNGDILSITYCPGNTSPSKWY